MSVETSPANVEQPALLFGSAEHARPSLAPSPPSNSSSSPLPPTELPQHVAADPPSADAPASAATPQPPPTEQHGDHGGTTGTQEPQLLEQEDHQMADSSQQQPGVNQSEENRRPGYPMGIFGPAPIRSGNEVERQHTLSQERQNLTGILQPGPQQIAQQVLPRGNLIPVAGAGEVAAGHMNTTRRESPRVTIARIALLEDDLPAVPAQGVTTSRIQTLVDQMDEDTSDVSDEDSEDGADDDEGDEGDEDEDVEFEQDWTWQSIEEDTSVPDKNELSMYRMPEVSALDHKCWEDLSFQPLGDPEYVPGASARIDWTCAGINGTEEEPNRRHFMESPMTNIGGYSWRIKFYPRGNNCEHLSVYVQCESMSPPRVPYSSFAEVGGNAIPVAPNGSCTDEGVKTLSGSEALATSAPRATPLRPPVTKITPPLPLMDGSQVVKRPGVAAQIGVVLYNPSEPRVNHFRDGTHHFNPGMVGWGWARFYGEHKKVHRRRPGQRAAMMRNDTVAFSAYIRIVHDATGCLWDHATPKICWNSFALTGLQDVEGWRFLSNTVSALMPWMLFRPFRKLLYDLAIPDPQVTSWAKPCILLGQLQVLLCCMRTPSPHLKRRVQLNRIERALLYYAIETKVYKMDVIHLWEILRRKIDSELKGTRLEHRMTEIFGEKRDYHGDTVSPLYRVGVKNVTDVQSAVANHASTLVKPGFATPELLSIELERQEFDSKSRRLVKITTKVKLNEHITVGGRGYTLYGHIAHKGDLQSGGYYPVLRPSGPNGPWFSYWHRNSERGVVCLSRREAIDAHEGGEKEPLRPPRSNTAAAKQEANGEWAFDEHRAVAYVVMYVRDDVAGYAFAQEAEPWPVSDWIKKAVRLDRGIKAETADKTVEMGAAVGSENLAEADGGNASLKAPKKDEKVKDANAGKTGGAVEIEVEVIDSRIVLRRSGLGVLNAYEYKKRRLPGAKYFIQTFRISSVTGARDLARAIARVLPGVQDPRQCRYWMLVPSTDFKGAIVLKSLGLPIDGLGQWTLGQALPDNARSCVLWVHVLDHRRLPPLLIIPETRGKIQGPQEITGAVSNSPRTMTGPAQATAAEEEDTVMSDVDAEPDADTANPTTDSGTGSHLAELQPQSHDSPTSPTIPGPVLTQPSTGPNVGTSADIVDNHARPVVAVVSNATFAGQADGTSDLINVGTTLTGQPPIYTGHPLAYTGQPQTYAGQPQTYTGQPLTYTGQPLTYTGRPPIYTGQPSAYTFQPPIYTGQPSTYTGQPPTYSGTGPAGAHPPPPPPPPPAPLLVRTEQLQAPALLQQSEPTASVSRTPSTPTPTAVPLAQVWYPPDDVYFFVKVFDPETQTLNLHGSFCAPSKVRLKDVALKLCRLANQASAEVWWEEREIVGDEFVPVRHLHNVPAERMIDGLILIVVPKPITSPDIRATLTARAFLLTLKSYVAAIYRRINYPDLVDGQFTLTYFSKEPFAGYLVHGRPHGRGKTISFTGDVYEGDFALGARQGSGKLTYANGNVYDGTWVDDKRDGHGRLLDVTTGNEYIGGWRGDRHFGSGVTTWKTAQEVEKLCRICWDTVADAALYDCGHVLACLTCARQVDRCPICRKRVLTALKLYFAIA